MKLNATVLYLGQDKDFFFNLSTFCLDIKTKALQIPTCKRGELSLTCLNHPLRMIFIDYTNPEVDLDAIQEEVIFLKRIPRFQSILFIALFSKSEEKVLNQSIFISGFQFSFMKGCDESLLFKDCFGIVTGKDMHHSVFAKAENILKNYEVGICSSLTSISMNDFIIESDFKFADSLLPISLPIFPDLQRKYFSISRSCSSSLAYPMPNSYVLELPISSGWDSDSLDVIQADTISTWLDHNSEENFKKGHFINVLSKNMALLPELFSIHKDSLFNINFNENLSDDEMLSLLSLSKPKLIFIDLETEGNNNLEFVSKIITSIKTIDNFDPVIIIANSLSTGNALQKVLSYPLILVTKTFLDTPFILSLIRSFEVRKLKKEMTSQSHFFSGNDPRRSVEVKCEIRISSLTEHEIVFLSQTKLPPLAILHFHLPLDFNATIVSERPENAHSESFYYIAIIHGMTEDKLEILRKFVNKIISNPLKEFSQTHIQEVLNSLEVNFSVKTDVPLSIKKNSNLDQ